MIFAHRTSRWSDSKEKVGDARPGFPRRHAPVLPATLLPALMILFCLLKYHGLKRYKERHHLAGQKPNHTLTRGEVFDMLVSYS